MLPSATAAHFFKKAPGKLRAALRDPAGNGSDIGAYLTGEKLERAVKKAATAYDRFVRAEAAANAGDLSGMHAEYGKIFGCYYPYSAG